LSASLPAVAGPTTVRRAPRWLQLAYFAGCIGAVTDAILTIALIRDGHGQEAYPPVRALIDALGLVPGLSAMVVVVLAGMTALAWFATRRVGSAAAVLAGYALAVFTVARYGAILSNLALVAHLYR
jgi:hypothetical protein